MLSSGELDKNICFSFAERVVGTFAPFIINPRKAARRRSLLLVKYEKPNTDPAYGFDLWAERKLNKVLVTNNFTGMVFSEERGWDKWDMGKKFGTAALGLNDISDFLSSQVFVICDPFDGSRAFASRVEMAETGVSPNPALSPTRDYLECSGASITLFNPKTGEITCAIVDYGLKLSFLLNQGQIYLFKICNDKNVWGLTSDQSIILPSVQDASGRKFLRVASLFFKDNRYNPWLEMMKSDPALKEKFKITGYNLGVSGLVDWLRREFDVACDLGKGQPWYELVPWLAFVQTLGGEVLVKKGGEIISLSVKELLQTGLYDKSARVHFIAGLNPCLNEAKLLFDRHPGIKAAGS